MSDIYRVPFLRTPYISTLYASTASTTGSLIDFKTACFVHNPAESDGLGTLGDVMVTGVFLLGDNVR